MDDGNVLLVEGIQDAHVFKHLCEHHGIQSQIVNQKNLAAQAISIKNEEGFPNLSRNLRGWLKGSTVKRLGIVADADTDVLGRWDSLRNRLIKSGYHEILLHPDSAGTVIVQDEQQVDVRVVGIWLMANNRDPGMLEDFVSSLIPPGNALWEQAKSYVDEIPEQDRLFAAEHRIKAHLHAWLAVQREPGQPFGYAIAKGYLDRDMQAATQLVAWLRRLFALA